MLFQKKKTDIMKNRRSIIVRTPLDKTLMEIMPSTDIPENAKELPIGQANNIMALIPNLLASNTLASSYKIVMPAGSLGELMKYKDGLLGTPIVDPSTGKVIGHAGLQALQPQAIALGVFTAISFVTGQYFMAEINQKLSSMKDAIHTLQAIMMNMEKSEVISAIYFLDCTDQNLNEILENREHQIATLTNVQNSTIKLLQATLFYEMQIKTVISNIKKANNSSDISSEVSVILEMINSWRLSTYGFYYGKTIEIRLSGNYSENYLKNVMDDLDGRSEFFKTQLGELYNLTINALETTSYTNRNIFEGILGWFNSNYSTSREIEVHCLKKSIPQNNEIIEREYSELKKISSSIGEISMLNNGMTIFHKNGKTYIK